MRSFLPPLLVLLAFIPFSRAQDVVPDPVPPVPLSKTFVWMRDFAGFPHTSGSRPYARINQLEPFTSAPRWLAANDLRGPLYLVNYQGKVVEYLDLRDEFPNFIDSPGLGTGFASFAAHPDFDSNGLFYTAHTEAPGSGTPTIPLPQPVNAAMQGVVIEWMADDPTATSFTGTHRELLRIDLTGSIHGIQEIAFRPGIPTDHPDYGLLFICIGEAQTLQRGPLSNIGTIESPISALFRIDPLGNNAPGGRYGIPADNPFVGTPGAVEEIWAHGFRNPHRIAWDNENNRLLLTDIGERQIEEINVIVPGGNYGWPHREGSFLMDPEGNTDVVYELPADDSGYIYPVAMYDHDDGFAIAGGHIYRNTRIPALTDMFLASDIKNGKLWMVPASELEPGSTTQLQRWLMRDANGSVDPYQMVGSSSRTDLRIGTDHFGEIYIITKQDAKVRKLHGDNEPASGYGMLEGFPWLDHWIDSSDFLGWVYARDYPWIYSPILERYIYNAPSDNPSGWIYLPR